MERHAPHADAIEAIERGARKLDEELARKPRADLVARREQMVGNRNHFAETWAAALHARQHGVEES